ncbi:MAG TPA: hypothetical protein VJ869_14305 [Sphaerochaeta sp.]|nr:hypothetical protein [Sphaerochaeta sp.]
MKETAIVLVIEIVVVALSLTAYKKQLRKTAKRAEIIWLAVILSTLLTISLGYGIPFVGMPFAVIAYIIAVFFLQWLVSQAIMDWGWKLIKGFIERKVSK